MSGTLHTVAYGPPATALLGRLVAHLQEADPFTPVTVVVPSATAGTTLRRAVARAGGGLVGVSFLSLPQVAATLAGPGPAAAVGGVVGRAHIRTALRQGAALTPDPAVSASAATERALAVTFAELAPLDERTLDVLAGAEPLAASVVEVYRRYRDIAGLPTGGHDVAGRAAVRVADGSAPLAGLGALVLHLPRRVRASEVALLRALVAAGVPVHGVIGRTGEADADTVADELAIALVPVFGEARWSGGPPAEPAHPIHLVRAPDPAEEVAVAVREVVAALTAPEPVAPERIALLYRARDPYLALLHAALDDAEVPHHAAAVTTLAQTVPGQVLEALLAVGAGGFRRADVVALWRSAPIVDPVTGRPITASRWDRLAREAGVGGGLDQWRSRLQRAIDTRLEHLARYRPASHVEPAEPTAGGSDDFRIEQWTAIGAHVDRLAELLRPPGDGRWATWSAWLLDLLTSLVDPTARGEQPRPFERVEAVLRDLARLDDAEEAPTAELLRRALEPELERPEPSHGRFGHGVVVGRLVDAVGADLDLVVVVGAADGQLPPRRVEDPLLRDAVRDLTGGALGRRGLRREEEHRDLLAALASAPRRVLTAPRADPRAQRERQPAAWFVAAASHHAGRMVASTDLGLLASAPWFTDVPSFEAQPAAMAAPATPRELDLGDLLAEHGQVGAGVVARSHPDLGRGLTAATSRRAGWFDRWSGFVGPDDSLGIDADRPRSPTGLERYAECPFRSFLSSVLHVGAIDDPTDADLISPLDEGSLVHQVLEEFIEEHAGKAPDEPWTDDERDRLDAIAAEVTDRYEAEGRTGKALLWGVRREQLRHQLQRVLDSDEVLRAREQVRPESVELMFGDGTDASPPVSVVLASGRTVSFRGIIDRVDRSIDGRRLVVYDYKTGSADSFAKVRRSIELEGDLTARGTKLQLPIYALAASAAHPGADEVSSYYWFVGRKGLGRTIGGVLDERAESRFREVIDVVVEGMEEGRFPANPGDESWSFGQWTFDHCGWCEFDRICPTSRGEQWVQVRTAPELARYRDLADPEPETDPEAIEAIEAGA